MTDIDWGKRLELYGVTPETTLEALKFGRKLLEKPQNWSRDAGLWTEDPEDCTYCIITALHNHGRNNPDNYYSRSAAVSVLTDAAVEKYGTPIDLIEWNDQLAPDHDSILETYDRAIAMVESDIAAKTGKDTE